MRSVDSEGENHLMIMKTRGHRGTTEAGSTVILKTGITRPS